MEFHGSPYGGAIESKKNGSALHTEPFVISRTVRRLPTVFDLSLSVGGSYTDSIPQAKGGCQAFFGGYL